MPICHRCGIACFDTESHRCSREASGAAVYFPKELVPRTRLVLFGAVSGGLWSVVPVFFVELWKPFGQAATAVLVGAVVGVLMAYSLMLPLRRWLLLDDIPKRGAA